MGAINEARGVPRTCEVHLAAHGTEAHPPRPQGRSRRRGRRARLRLLWLRSVLAPPADGSPGSVRLGWVRRAHHGRRCGAHHEAA